MKNPVNSDEKLNKVEKYEYKYKRDYTEDWDIHRKYTETFDPYEAMLVGQVYDSISNSIDNSKITDSYAATLAKERADRVIAKLPEGETQSVGIADVGKAAFMDILRQKWVYPNANAQRPFVEKLNLWQLYSSVYGYMPMFYDWNVSNTGYVGPDCWLWNPRNLVPQQGRVSIEDMDYVTALTWVSKSHLEKIRDGISDNSDDGWDIDALDALIELAEDTLTDPDTDKDTQVARERVSQATRKGICLATRYESGEDGMWITFAPDNGYVQVRSIKNPHKNGRIPFVVKYSQPLFDSFYGLGDFQRAKPLQFARDGLTNLYFKGIRLNLVQPIVANANGVLKHTLDYREGGVMLETIPGSIRTLNVSTAGLNTYQGAQSNLTGSLLSQFGTQNASLPGAETLNPTQGKTPAAIEMYSGKEATRDGAERLHLETAIEQLTDGFNSMIVNIGTEDIPITLFYEDIVAIKKSGLNDIADIFKGKSKLKFDETETAADLVIDPKKLKGVEYRFNITPNSTAKVNKEEQLKSLERFIDNMGKFQNIFKDDPRVELHPDKIGAAFGTLADIQGADEFVTVNDGPTKEQLEMQKMAQELEMKNKDLEQQLMEMQKMQQEQAAMPQQTAAPQSGAPQFTDPDIAAYAQQLEG